MQITRKLLGFLNRVFRKDGAPLLAFRLTYTGAGMTWQVQDQVLTTTVAGGAGAALSINLTQYTVASLVEFLASQPGYSVLNVNETDFVGLGAVVLIDGSGDINTSNGDHLYGATGLSYLMLDAAAVELSLAEQAIAAMPAEMATTSADGQWLDYIGSFYRVPRLQDETDQTYAPRIPATILQPKANNKAIELAIKNVTGQVAIVTDVISYAAADQTFDGSFDFDGSHTFSSALTGPVYGLFDVQVGYDLVGQTDLTEFSLVVQALIETLRDAGTQLRNITVNTGSMSDAVTAATEAATESVTRDHLFDGELLFDGSFTFGLPTTSQDALIG